ncbi:MAG: hypothetical protein H0T62_00890 [Parachlamydiaceae bacterium]|nr:hypothetical protein [Parachlamydiaceae bacterium]
MVENFNFVNFYITLLAMQATLFLSYAFGPARFFLKKSAGGKSYQGKVGYYIFLFLPLLSGPFQEIDYGSFTIWAQIAISLSTSLLLIIGEKRSEQLPLKP